MRIKGIFDAKICVVKGKCGMKLSVCNIAWTAEHDAKMYGKMKELGMEGIEIAPTRIFPDVPYEHLSGAHLFAEQLKKEYGLSVASMQSIWYQRTEKLFGSEAERETLLFYTKQAIDFAEAAGCPNLVFGSPKNRGTVMRRRFGSLVSWGSTQRNIIPAFRWRQIRRSMERILSIVPQRRLHW